MNIEQLYKIFSDCRCVSTDSREGKGIFFGLKGERFDGSIYGDSAIANGAICAVTQNGLETLQELAKYHRKHLTIPIIGLTGTNGKTTTKELIVKVLQTKYKVGYTKGNLNNHIGVPLTLLSFFDDIEIAIVEMGANHEREIATLCQIASPNVGLITNVGYAHLEGFGSFEGVMKTKGELYDFLQTNGGMALYNADDLNLTSMIAQRAEMKAVGYHANFDEVGDIEGCLTFKYNGKKYVTKLVGGYNLYNIGAAMEVGKMYGIEPELALEAICNYEPTNNRSQILKTERNILFMDAYNANPSSMNEAVSNFAKLDRPNKIVILGDMKELGDFSEEQHLKIAMMAHQSGFDSVFLVGAEFAKVDSHAFLTAEQMIPHLNKIDNASILIKGSRGMKMESLTDYL